MPGGYEHWMRDHNIPAGGWSKPARDDGEEDWEEDEPEDEGECDEHSD